MSHCPARRVRVALGGVSRLTITVFGQWLTHPPGSAPAREHVKSDKLVKTLHTKGSGYGPPPTSQQGAFQQDEDFSTGGASEPIPKGSQKYSEQMRGQQGSLLLFSSNRPHHTGRDKGIRKNCAKSRQTMYHVT